jgi:uncharacterized repeat protein (TIGR01451 family)
MSLENLNERLHSRDAHLEKGRLLVEEEHTQAEIEAEKQAFQKPDDWQTSPKQEMYLVSPDLKALRQKKIYWGIGIISALLILGGAGFFGYTFLKRQSAVSLEITGPISVASAERVSFDVLYQNNSFSETQNNVLTVTMPDSFQIEAEPGMTVTGRRVEVKLDNVAASTGGKVTVMGKFFGGKGDKQNIEAVLRYSPKSSSSQFESKASHEVILATSPLLFEVSAPSEVASGQELDYVIEYENKSPETFRNVRVVAVYPDGFQYLSATVPPTSNDHEWFLPELKPSQNGKIVIHGVLSGEKDSTKIFKATIGMLQGDNTLFAYNTVEKKTQIVGSPLTISQKVNESIEAVVNPGDTLNYVVNYKNTSAVGMRDVVIAVSIDTRLLDISKLKLEQGSYDDKSKKIIWRASDIPELGLLAPGKGGGVSFSIPVAKDMKIEPSEAKNLTIRSMATIDSPDVKTVLQGNKIIGSNLLLVKVGALVALSTTPYFGETAFPNTGPLPPVVGTETTYTLKTKVESTSNDLTQTKVVFVIPSGVVYKEKSSPGDETVKFNSRTNELIWEIGTLSPRKEKVLEFQVGVTPNDSQVGQDIELVKKTVFSAKDSFTKKDITTERGSVMNNLNQDNTVANQSGAVVKN